MVVGYTEDYNSDGFEKYQIIYRRKKLSEIMEKYQPKTVLEIGTGMEPLFHWSKLEGVQKHIFVEPNKVYFDRAVELAGRDDKITGYNMYYVPIKELKEYKIDFISCSGVLRGVQNPDKFLQDIAEICTENTVLNISEANAESLHRLVAKEMGLIKDLYVVSERSKGFGYDRCYTLQDLKESMVKNGFKVLEAGTYFIKPFAHHQMYDMMQEGIIDERVLDGLYSIEKYLPGLGSEIFVNAKIGGR